MFVKTGITVSPGVAFGEAVILDNRGFHVPRRIVPKAFQEENLERFRQALDQTAQEIQQSREVISQQLGESYGAIFEAHLEMLQDVQLKNKIEKLINQQYAAESAVSEVLQQYQEAFANLGNAYLAQRAHDIEDIEKRILRQLMGDRSWRSRLETLLESTENPIILAHNLTPSETAYLDQTKVAGLATESGGSGSHTAIVASALGIPGIVGIGPFLSHVNYGDPVILDGNAGRIILNPDEKNQEYYRGEVERDQSRKAHLQEAVDLPAQTKDGVRIQLLTNIEFPHEAEQGPAIHSDGVGLYRTEFLYLGADEIPSEEDHFQSYCKVLDAMGDKPVVIRTLDLGADKLSTLADAPCPEDEKNPFLGLRSIRLSLRNLSHFHTQLKAILRASVRGQVRIMFPLISTLTEWRHAKAALNNVKEDLDEQGIAYSPDVRVGMMVEVPSAVLMIDQFCREVDFFSIGTNDLIQYCLAVDRGNKDVAYLYNNSDPAVLRLMKQVVEAGRKAEVPVSVCGQMCSNPVYTMALVGLGFRSLSVPPSALSQIKTVLRELEVDHCREVADKILQMDNAKQVNTFLRKELSQAMSSFEFW
ncbi:Phosphoenolpyruvate--protein phosphotransferase [Planctomycetales bacterium 10988]|nr:Phosphoenolpyruvate--protein phosphotransferase [Planctomycetales bacterium 10988]